MSDTPTGPRPSPGKEGKWELLPHSGFPHPAIEITVDAALTDEGAFVLRYLLTGRVQDIKTPPPVRYASRGTDLWRTTCFEAFVGLADSGEYLEINFAPSTAWEVYQFTSYRERGDVLPFPAPVLDIELGDGRMEVVVTADMAETPYMAVGTPWRVGLSAIIEAKDGSKSYWALAHPPGKPDFHNRDCFTARLAAPNAA